VYHITGNSIPREDVQALAARLPNMRLHHRGASLGISGPAIDICYVDKILENSPAQQAGLRPGDMIEALGNEPIGRFQELVEKLIDRAPGETVTIKLRRRSEQTGDLELIEKQVVLGNWKELRSGLSRSQAQRVQPMPPLQNDLFPPPQFPDAN
jgi:C-terminal processing protease CtpA/Prc